MEAIHRITSDDMEFMENFRQNIIHVIGNYSTAKAVSYTHLDVYKRQVSGTGQDAGRFKKTQKVLNHDEMAQPSYG